MSTRLLLFSLCGAVLSAQATDPELASWQTATGRRYARVAQGSTATPSDTWPTGVITGQIFGGQSTPAYSDVERVTYSSSYVYVNSTGLASYTMGPWFQDAAKTILFQNWPADQGILMRFPRTPALAATATTTGGGPIALAVNGVVFYNGQDAFSYSHSAGTDLMAPQGDGIWNRDALLNEAVTFDPTLAHQQNTGQYHYHVNPIGLRAQLGDHVTYASSTGAYAESTTAPVHSPILGWAFDGYPIYGPYGYSSALDPTSGVRRMVSGFVPRDGTHGTTNLASTGRVSLPHWAVAAQGRTTGVLASTQMGPAVSAARPLGYYQEDNDYLGDEGYTQGADFDLNVHNARYCVTPDYPQGTWAYFVSIDSSNQPAFPYTVGPQYLGVVSGGTVPSIAEPVTEYARGGAAAPIAVTVVATGTGAAVTWTSVEGGSYLVESSADDATWTTLASNVASAGTATSYTASSVETYYRVTLTALATYDTAGSGSVTAVGGNAVGQLVGSTGTAYLSNLSTLVPVGGTAGTPAVGLILSGAGTKNLLLRAVGPSLTAFGVAGVLSSPELTIYSGSNALGTYTGWNASLASVFTSVGAFALTAQSLDAAAEVAVPAGSFSSTVSSASGGTGAALLEVYDPSPGNTPGLANLSARSSVAPGSTVTVGFVVEGAGTMQLLLRGVGPGLGEFGLTGLLSDPTLTLYRGTTAIASNSGWSGAGNAAAIQAAASQVSAFSLTSGSKDSALLVNLAPGAYTLTVGGASGDGGTTLAEVYVVR